ARSPGDDRGPSVSGPVESSRTPNQWRGPRNTRESKTSQNRKGDLPHAAPRQPAASPASCASQERQMIGTARVLRAISGSLAIAAAALLSAAPPAGAAPPPHETPPSGCQLGSRHGDIEHVIYIIF